MIVFSLSAVSADDLQTTDSGQVSGDVDVATVSPWDTTGELTYDIPAEAKEIKSADVYVNVYAGSAANTRGANANVSLKTADGENQIASEELWIENGTSDGTIYPVNDHTDKCYSDYQMHYDVTDSLKGLNGSSIAIKVNTFEMENKTFDGRIKLIALILAYDDGDNDKISYWVDTTQKWTKTNVTTTFDTEALSSIKKADLINVALSSANGNFTLNEEPLGSPDDYSSGSYYQYSCWDVSDKLKAGEKTELVSRNVGTSSYASLKNVLTVLKVEEMIAEVSLNTEYTSVKTAYAGTNNTLTINVNANKAGKYVVELLADGSIVNSTEIDLDGENAATVLLTDPTVRPIDETTVNGADNAKVVYSANVKFDDDVVAAANITVPVLYNGYLSSDYAFNATGFEEFRNLQISGEIVVDVKDVSTYLAASAMNRTDVWTINLDEGCEIVDAYIFVPYNWFNAKTYNETEEMFDLTFNGNEIVPVGWYRDQGNLGNYGKYGYGVLIYRVENLINSTGDNTLVLNKVNPTPAVYPSTLVYFYNAPGSSVKEVSLIFGADLLSNDYNKAGRTVQSDIVADVANMDDVENATLYVFAASAQKGESNIIVNGKVFEDVWNGTSSTTDLFTADITDVLSDSNNISFVSTGSTILALPQILVVDSGMSISIDSIKTEYTSVPTAFAGTSNVLTVTVSNSKEGEFDIYLLSGLTEVDHVNVNLTNGTHSIELCDLTIRPIDETTENGADNKEVTYNVAIMYNGHIVYETLTVPVLYNGYLAKDFEFNATPYEAIEPIAFTGDIVIDTKDESSYKSGAEGITEIWTVDNDDIVKAFIYVPYNWFNGKLYVENDTMFDVVFNNATVTPVGFYRDQGNLGNYGKYGYGVLIYDVSDLIAAGNNTFVLSKVNPTPTIYPTSLVYAYNTTGSGMLKTAYILNGADLLSDDYNKAERLISLDTEIDVDLTNVTDATLYVFAASAQKGESNILVNSKIFKDVWDGTSKTTDLFTANITDIVNSTNDISFISTGSTILALPQIIVTTQVIPLAVSVDKIATEYTSVMTAYAGTNNTLTVTVNANQAIAATVELLADGVVVDSVDVDLIAGNNNVLVTDPTVRPIDESTVNGANNTKVVYSVNVKSGDDTLADGNLTVPVLYNGNLGKDYAFNATGFEDFVSVKVTGDIVIDIKDVSSYLAAAAMNRTDVWAVNLSEDSSFVNAYIYVPYNWFNGKTYNETEDMFNVTFNGASLAPVAWYRDQGNLGNYGKYGYGVFVYDVSDLIANGDNTLTLDKVNPTPAVYPSALIYMYNTTNSAVVKNIVIVNGADLLANSNNKAGRIVKADSIIDAQASDIVDATLYVLAASAQKGESNIIFNGVEFSDVWNGTSSTTDVFAADVTDIIKDSNDISFVAIGSTILALPQIIVTSEVSLLETVLNVTVNDVTPGETASIDISFDANITDEVEVLLAGQKYIVPIKDGKGQLNVSNLTANKYVVQVVFPGNSVYLPAFSSTVFNVNRLDTIITVDAKFSRVATDYYAGERGDFFYAVLTDINGNPLVNKTVQIAVNGPIYNVTTDEQGRAGLQVNLAAANTYTYALSFQGDDQYNAAPLASSKLTVTKKSTSITAANKAF
uniref:DUF3344 domain-containing protein n=1 Tax=Methanobrevibacter sp. TaxID=66852 RepID=UPI00386F5068